VPPKHLYPTPPQADLSDVTVTYAAREQRNIPSEISAEIRDNSQVSKSRRAGWYPEQLLKLIAPDIKK
jgi:hypothetical protein